jgi:broad specificity phosphatase PhoE
MQIVLLRHGRPDILEYGKMNATEFSRYVESYNSAGIDKNHKPSKEAIEIAYSCNTVVCSDLLRSIKSARLLDVNEIDYIEPVFREVELPHGRFPVLRLSPNIWAVYFRVLCFFGYSSNGESLGEGKSRASKAANKLKQIAENNGSVLLVGHGFTNRLIAKDLLSSGWQGPANPGNQFWEFGVYKNTQHNQSLNRKLRYRGALPVNSGVIRKNQTENVNGICKANINKRSN